MTRANVMLAPHVATIVSKSAATVFVAAFSLVAAVAHAQTPAAPAPLVAAPMAAPRAYVHIGEKPAILYDALGAKSGKLFVLGRNYPLEALVKLDKWTKVRDADGTVGWVDNTVLGPRRFVQVATTMAEVQAIAASGSPLVFTAERGVLLEVIGPPQGAWLSVAHRDGQAGYVLAAQVFGE